MAGGQTSGTSGQQQAGSDLGASVQLEQLGRSLGLGGDLTGFKPTGQLTVDGKTVSAENLEALLRAIIAGQVSVRSITVR